MVVSAALQSSGNVEASTTQAVALDKLAALENVVAELGSPASPRRSPAESASAASEQVARQPPDEWMVDGVCIFMNKADGKSFVDFAGSSRMKAT